MKEIGGYIEFEHYYNKMLHEDGIKLNCGRNCLAYLIEAKKIDKIWIPYFMCASIKEISSAYPVGFDFYFVGKNLMPIEESLDRWEKNDYLYLMNYYGQMTECDLRDIKGKYNNIILDNAQAYFNEPLDGIDTFYTCRKFFGVADGAILYTDVEIKRDLPQDESFQRMEFLLGRFERRASEFYGAYVKNNEYFCTEPIKKMSALTENLLRGIDYTYICDKRTENFKYLHEKLSAANKLKIQEVKGAFAYPLWIEKGREVRKKLIEQKIFVPILWPNVIDEMPTGSLEFELADNILPLPCDQRYTIKDMNYICESIFRIIES